MPRIPENLNPPEGYKERRTKGPTINPVQPGSDPFAAMQSVGSLFAELSAALSTPQSEEEMLSKSRKCMAEDTSTLPEDLTVFDAKRKQIQAEKRAGKHDASLNLQSRKAKRALDSTLKPNGPTAMRLMRSTLDNPLIYSEVNGRALQLFHQHSLFCQVGLPYRKPADDVREYDRANGTSRLKIYAGHAMHPETGEFIKVGLPWGPKVRIVQIYLDSVAVTTQSLKIETEHSLTAFVTKKLRLRDDGPTIHGVKDALSRLAASRFVLGTYDPEAGHSTTRTLEIIDGFDIWMEKKGNRFLFPSSVEFSAPYFASLMDHAVPLKLAAVAALSHSAMAIDCYRWLAHRLHRIPVGQPVLLFWSLLYDQFSTGRRMRMADFRSEFKNALAQAVSQYPEARNRVQIDKAEARSLCKDGRGLWLHHAPPPVLKKQLIVKLPKQVHENK